MKVVWKFPLELSNFVQEISLPNTNCFLHAAMQDGTPTAWFEVDPAQPKMTIPVRIFGTGQAIVEDDAQFRHMATFMHGIYVWHLYEIVTDDLDIVEAV